MPEQFAFRHALRQRCAVKVDQRAGPARRSFVDGFRHQLFTRTGFPANQHVKIGGRHNRNLFFQLRHIVRQADHLLPRRLSVTARLARQHVLAFKLGNQERIIQRARHQRGDQPQLFIAEIIEAVGGHAVESQRANQILPGKQR